VTIEIRNGVLPPGGTVLDQPWFWGLLALGVAAAALTVLYLQERRRRPSAWKAERTPSATVEPHGPKRETGGKH
jgi:hypothetical protein